MDFLVEHLGMTPAEVDTQYKTYYEYLQSVKTRLPANAFDFATASWHYDPSDHRCPHDSWVESLAIKENSSGNRRQYRSIQLHLQLLGAYHDGWIELIYKGVKDYSLNLSAANSAAQPNVAHGDWLRDEVRLSERDLVIHEIVFSQKSSWLIECEDIVYAWVPFTAA